MRLSLALLLAGMLAAPAAATEPADAPIPGAVDIPPGEWSEMAAGRTLSYAIGGRFWALERYEAQGDGVALEFRDGTCLVGRWEYVAPLYCYHWEGEGTSCFRHVRVGDDILILETEGGQATGAIQVMTGVSDVPLACGGTPTS
jgi:hypothetical protein